MFVNKHFTNTSVDISKSKRFQNAKPSAYYFYVKPKMSLDFQIYIGVPLIVLFARKTVRNIGLPYIQSSFRNEIILSFAISFSVFSYMRPQKFYIRRNNNNQTLLKQGAQLLLICFPEVIQKSACTPCFLINDDKILSSPLNL